MPYTIVKRQSQYCVVKKTDPGGHSFGCHDDKDGAVAQIGAIESHERRAGKAFDNDIALREYLASPAYETEYKALADTLRMPIEEQVPEAEAADKETASIASKWISALKALFTPPAYDLFEVGSGFKVLENHRWMAWFTNNFQDRDGEVFSAKALDAYVSKVQSGQLPLPQLWTWHLPASKHGQATHVGRVGHFLMAIGTFDESKLGQKMEAFYRGQKDVALSHGYLYPLHARDKDGTYHEFVTFEISTLPRTAAANPYTYFERFSTIMKDVKDAHDWLSSALKDEPELLAQIQQAAQARGKAIEEQGVDFKADAPAATATPPAAPAEITALEAKISELEAKILTLTEGLTPAAEKAVDIEALGAKVNQLEGVLENLEGFVREKFGKSTRASRNVETAISEKDLQLQTLLKNSEAPQESFLGSLVKELHGPLPQAARVSNEGGA